MIKLALAAVAAATLATSPLKATLTAPSHTPKVNTHWNFVLRATSGGRAVKARLTAQIVDPIGGVHYVGHASTTRPIKNWPFTGVYRDYVVWPSSSRGIPLTLRLTVVAGTAHKVIDYHVVPRA